jgi:hypothetical protein
MGKYSEAFIAFDVAKRKHAVAIAEGGRTGEVRFVGEVELSGFFGCPLFGRFLTLVAFDALPQSSPQIDNVAAGALARLALTRDDFLAH